MTSYYINCKNCGKQVIMDAEDFDDKCYWCGESVTMVRRIRNQEELIPSVLDTTCNYGVS